jgi:hypothetical protein
LAQVCVLVLWREGQYKITDVNFIRATASIFDINNDAHAGIIADDGVQIAVFFPTNIGQRPKDVLKRDFAVAVEACTKNRGSGGAVQSNYDGSL